MKTPISDFITEYAASDFVRLHMPGHKGQVFLGCEARDITEIAGADALYEASELLQKVRQLPQNCLVQGRHCLGRKAPVSVSGQCWSWH